ncbi:MAG: hypothetical protein V7K41_17900 [Nostoc sp.]|uniref:hypothetical protein n=1 Tax=Nostoc sp. TaxID=1180 RepID=UPI002FF59F63
MYPNKNACIVCQFPNLGLEEIEAMLDLDEFVNTRLYKSILEKSRLKLAPKLSDKGMSIQEIAELLEIDVEVIRKYLQ